MKRRFSYLRPLQISLRWRLTLWYTLSLGILLILFGLFLYFQVGRSLIAQLDASLRLAASQAIIIMDEENDQLTFRHVESNPKSVPNLSQDFLINLVAADGETWDTLSSDFGLPAFLVQDGGFHTVFADGEPWRIYVQDVNVGRTTGKLQVAQELEPIYFTLANLQGQLLLVLPIALLVSTVGGYFMASRALRPIDQMTQTAKTITASDLNQRIQYQGPADEIGRLAQTFDAMLDRLQAAFVRERRFTGDAAHELRTPLTALKGRIDVTLSRRRQPETYIETLQEMEEQVDRLIRLSSDLLFMSRLEQDKFQLQLEPIELEEFLGVVVDQIRPLTVAKNITLTQTIPADLIIEGDIDLLIRLFLNLLDNAIKYTPDNGRIAISATQDKTSTTISIRDSGPGITPDHLPHLFERFYRVEDDRSRRLSANGHGGAGLGLAIANEITRAHIGTIDAQSELGQGTTFNITFYQNLNKEV